MPSNTTTSSISLSSNDEPASEQYFQEKYQRDAQALIAQTRENLKQELQKDAPSKSLNHLEKQRNYITGAIKWLEKEEEITAKIANTECFSHNTPEREMEELREAFQKRILEENASISMRPFDKSRDAEWLQQQNQLLKRKLEEELKAIGEAYEKELEVLTENTIKKGTLLPPTIWGIPEAISTDGHLERQIIYSGKTPEKTVYKPWERIHQSLIDANWHLRAGGTYSQNYLTAHLLFTITDRPHQKSAIEGSSTSRYVGGRRFIDFPIVFPLDLLTTQHEFASKEEYYEFLWNQRTSIMIGRSQAPKEKGAHSEVALRDFLLKKENVEKIVQILKHKLLSAFGTNEGFKVYEVNLFINSNKNPCASLEGGCENILHHLMSPPQQNSNLEENFLFLLKTMLERHGFKTLTHSNNGYPRMFINVSAYEYYGCYTSNRLQEQAKKGLKEWTSMKVSSYPTYAIDTKLLAGNVILTTPELEIKGRAKYRKEGSEFAIFEEYEKYNCPYDFYINSQKEEYTKKVSNNPEVEVPFYTGFRSSAGNMAFLGYPKTYLLPNSFDKLPLIVVKAPTEKIAITTSEASPTVPIEQKDRFQKIIREEQENRSSSKRSFSEVGFCTQLESSRKEQKSTESSTFL